MGCALSLNVGIGQISTDAIRRDGVINNPLVANSDLLRRKDRQIGKVRGNDPLEILEVAKAFVGIGLDRGGFQKAINFGILVMGGVRKRYAFAASRRSMG